MIIYFYIAGIFFGAGVIIGFMFKAKVFNKKRKWVIQYDKYAPNIVIAKTKIDAACTVASRYKPNVVSIDEFTEDFLNNQLKEKK